MILSLQQFGHLTGHVSLAICQLLALWCECLGIHVLEFTSLLTSVPLPLQMSHCQLPESNLTLQSSIQGWDVGCLCLVSGTGCSFAFIYAVSVNTPSLLYATAFDDISHPSQAFVRQLNPVPIAFAGQQRNGKP